MFKPKRMHVHTHTIMLCIIRPLTAKEREPRRLVPPSLQWKRANLIANYFQIECANMPCLKLIAFLWSLSEARGVWNLMTWRGPCDPEDIRLRFNLSQTTDATSWLTYSHTHWPKHTSASKHTPALTAVSWTANLMDFCTDGVVIWSSPGPWNEV